MQLPWQAVWRLKHAEGSRSSSCHHHVFGGNYCDCTLSRRGVIRLSPESVTVHIVASPAGSDLG
jgi:hypothetical protein